MHSELQPSEHLKVESSIWLPLNVVSNGNASSSSQAVGVTKIAKSVIAPLAQQHVSVFMLSTYQTDFILVSTFLFSLHFVPLQSKYLSEASHLPAGQKELHPPHFVHSPTFHFQKNLSQQG